MSANLTFWIIVGLVFCLLIGALIYVLRYHSKSTSPYAAASYEQHTLQELIDALEAGPKEADMKEWNLTPEEWTEQIQLAIKKKKLAIEIASRDAGRIH
jgi:hypothetical protein